MRALAILFAKTLFLTATMVNIASAKERIDFCVGIFLNDTQAIEDPSTTHKQYSFISHLTQYNIDKDTGKKTYCQHGGYCYLADNIQLLNCKLIPTEGDDSFFGLTGK